MDTDAIVQRMRDQVARGELVLFTGAGFSFGARDSAGQPIPLVSELKEEIWRLLWPDDPVASDATLADTYGAAMTQAQNRLRNLMLNRLRVAPDSVTDAHRTWLSMPWRRAYTLNVDDLEVAAGRQFELPSAIRSVSALDRTVPLDTAGDLLYIHLNGTLEDLPNVTFSAPQYGGRQGESNPLYEKLAADLTAYPVVFVGTELRESLFWQYVALRDARGPRGTSEWRPRSYLVTPELPRDRRALLRSFNIEWVQATAEEFADAVLSKLSAESAQGHRMRKLVSAVPGKVFLPKVSELASQPEVPGSEYLMGARPTWADIIEGRAIERAFEREVDIDDLSGVLVVSGTAGSGTSTVLKRLALRASAANHDVRWIDANHGFSARDLGRYLREHDGRLTIVIDDADTFGKQLAELVDDIETQRPRDLLILGMRATRIDTILPEWDTRGRTRNEIGVPLLEDSDIDGLLEVLDENNKLGALKRLSLERRQAAVREECGRELLVAMIEATSGQRFEVKVAEEWQELPEPQRRIYGIVALASSLRFFLPRDEILVASGDIHNTTLNALNRLVARKLLTQRPQGFAVRHRRIAELVVAGLRRSGTLYPAYAGLLRSLAIRVDSARRVTREAKLLTALLSHERILRSFALDDARRLYDSVEEALRDDYHYWLQRGSLEVEHGSNLPAARMYLQHAFAEGSNDFRVQTEWAYYLIKSAYKDPKAADAREKVEEAEAILLEGIERRGGEDAYAYHVYGSQMLAWLRRAPIGDDDRAQKLEHVKNRVKDGRERHPYAADLQELHKDIEVEWLRLAVPREQR